MINITKYFKNAHVHEGQEIEILITKVEEMREAQRNYFKTRSQGFLIKSKNLEKDVDLRIENLNR